MKSIVPKWLWNSILVVLAPAILVVGSSLLGVSVMLLQGATVGTIWDLIKLQLIGVYELIIALVLAFVVQRFIFSGTAQLSHSFHSRLPLTPQRRVDHVLCDFEKQLENRISWFLIFIIFGAIRLYAYWSEERSLRIGFIIVAIIAIGITIRFGIRNGHRKAITEQLKAERCEFDPEQKNPKVFVSKRDVLPRAVQLFDCLTRACYARGLTVLQYSDFEWATYSETVTPVHKSPIVIKHKNNPQVVAMANVVLWLDIGKQSKAMKAELNEASKRRLKVVRLGECSTDHDDFIIETGGGMPNYVRKTDAPEYLGDLLRQIVSDQMRSKDLATDQKVEGKG